MTPPSSTKITLLEYMRSRLAFAGIAPRFWPSFEYTKVFAHVPRNRYDDGVRYHAKVTAKYWKWKDWETSTEPGEGYLSQKLAQDALALKIANFIDVDAVDFIKRFVETRAPTRSSNPFAMDARPQKIGPGDFTVEGYEGDIFEGIAQIIGSYTMTHIFFTRAYARKLAFMLAKSLTILVPADSALIFCESFCRSADNILQKYKPPEDYEYAITWGEHLLMALGRYHLTGKETVEVELLANSMCRVVLWEHIYGNERDGNCTSLEDIKVRACKLGEAVGDRLRIFGYDISTFFNDSLHETLQKRILKRKAKEGNDTTAVDKVKAEDKVQAKNEADAEDEAQAEDSYTMLDMMDLDW